MTKPTTRIGTPTSETTKFRMRGKDVLKEIVGHKSFSEAFYFIVSGREPSAGGSTNRLEGRLASGSGSRLRRSATSRESARRTGGSQD